MTYSHFHEIPAAKRRATIAGPMIAPTAKKSLYCIHGRSVFSGRSCDLPDQSERAGFENSDRSARNHQENKKELEGLTHRE